jgi:hypothetical protein
MSDTGRQLQYNKLFEFNTLSNSNKSICVPPYVITSVTLRAQIRKYVEECRESRARKARKQSVEQVGGEAISRGVSHKQSSK